MSDLPDEATPPDIAAAARRLPLHDVPDDVSQRLRGIYRDALPVIPADLIDDTRQDALLAGTRGGVGSAWTMSYRAGECDIVLDLVPRRRVVGLAGQLLCPEPTPDTILRVFREDELVTAASTDDFGQFDLGELLRGKYDVTVTHRTHLIELVVDLDGPGQP